MIVFPLPCAHATQHRAVTQLPAIAYPGDAAASSMLSARVVSVRPRLCPCGLLNPRALLARLRRRPRPRVRAGLHAERRPHRHRGPGRYNSAGADEPWQGGSRGAGGPGEQQRRWNRPVPDDRGGTERRGLGGAGAGPTGGALQLRRLRLRARRVPAAGGTAGRIIFCSGTGAWRALCAAGAGRWRRGGPGERGGRRSSSSSSAFTGRDKSKALKMTPPAG